MLKYTLTTYEQLQNKIVNKNKSQSKLREKNK